MIYSSDSSRKQIFRNMLCLICVLDDAILMSKFNIPQHTITLLKYPHLTPGAMIRPQRLEQPMSRTGFHGPVEGRVIEVRL